MKHKQIIRYKEERDYLEAEFTDGSIVKYEKPSINVFERYGTMVYFHQDNTTILIIDNVFRRDKFDTVELKEKNE